MTAYIDGPPERQLSIAVELALESMVGVTVETLREVVGISPETFAAMSEDERSAIWTLPRLLTLVRYFRQQADYAEQVTRNIRHAATVILEEALLMQLAVAREREPLPSPVVLPPFPPNQLH